MSEKRYEIEDTIDLRLKECGLDHKVVWIDDNGSRWPFGYFGNLGRAKIVRDSLNVIAAIRRIPNENA